MKSVDLHVHSNKSDGTLAPSDLVTLALSKGLSAFALTDHDTTEGIDEALAAASAARTQGVDIEVIPGIEFSTEYEGKDIHIVGLDIDYRGESFQKYLKDFHNTVCCCLNKLVVMAGEQLHAGEFNQTVVQCSDGFHIKMVGRLI